MIFKRKKKDDQPTKEFGAWCELITLLDKKELEHLVIIENEWKAGGNLVSGRFNLNQYLLVIKSRREA